LNSPVSYRQLALQRGNAEALLPRKFYKSFARAPANDPKVILADEPTGNLDTFNSRRIIELLRQLSDQGKTVVVVTHDRSIAKDADVRLEMEDGRVRTTGNYVAATRSPTLTHKKKGKKK
jgi:ABC-type lipoprotein export system ATPase subunit